MRTRYLVMATGGYSVPIKPTIEGVDSFDGELYYTSRWPRSRVEFAGKRVGIVGTGSSGMQVISAIAHRRPAHLYVFQRTANFCVPANNYPLTDEYQHDFKSHYEDHRARARKSGFGVDFPVGIGVTADLTDQEFLDRMRTCWEYGGPAVLAAFPDLLKDERANRRVAEYLRQAVRERVTDPDVADMLCANDHFVGSRRVLVESDYLDAFNRPNVTLVDARMNPITQIYSGGLATSSEHYELDMLVMATGFDSATGAVLGVEFEGRSGQLLADVWGKGARTYLGMMVSGFPNMFIMAGPGSPGIRAQGILIAEEQTTRIAQIIGHMNVNGLVSVDVTDAAQDRWTAYVAKVAESALVSRDETQYVGANVPGKPRVYSAYLGGFGYYFTLFDGLSRDGYPGFSFANAHGEVVCVDENWPGDPADENLITAI